VPHVRDVSVDDLVNEIRGPAPFLKGVTVSGGEATQQAEFVHALFAALRADPDLRRLTLLVDSNGSCDTHVWDDLAPVMDGAMIDLKALDPVVHLAMTGQPNDAVLRSIRHLHAIGKLEEVRLLIVPGHNDDDALIDATARWLADVDPAMRIKVIGFRRHGARASAQGWPEAKPSDLERVAAILRAHGCDELLLI
jgi:pyruvate-formate lyase-activating enzyme